MKNKKMRILTGFIMSIVLMVTIMPVSYVNAEDKFDEKKGNEVVDDVVETLVGDNPEFEDMEDALYDDLEEMEAIGLDLELLDKANFKDNKAIYTYTFQNDCTDEIMLEQNDKSVIMNISEGEKQNNLEIKDDGNIYLDGEKIDIETMENDADNYEQDDELKQSVAGCYWNWYSKSKAPSHLKKASYEKSVHNSYKVKNVKLAKAVKSITTAAFIAILAAATNGIELASLAKAAASGVGTSALQWLVEKDPNTKNISIKDKIYMGKCRRYYKCVRQTWAVTGCPSNKPSKKCVAAYAEVL